MSFGRLIACLMLASSASHATVPAQAQTKVLRVVPHADLTQLDPVFASIVITREYGLMIYEELFAWDSKLQPRPQMVESWTTSPDVALHLTGRPEVPRRRGGDHRRCGSVATALDGT